VVSGGGGEEPGHLVWREEESDQRAVDGQVARALFVNKFGHVNPLEQRRRRRSEEERDVGDAPVVVDRYSLTFGRTGDEESLHLRGYHRVPSCRDYDVNGDELPDLICHFHTSQMGFQEGDVVGILRGQTLDGIWFESQDSVEVVPDRIPD